MIEHERDKYTRMWARPEYHRWSPGAESVAEFVAMIGNRGSVTDFGCGDGKALDLLIASGFEAMGVDLVTLRSDVVNACLWDLPTSLPVVEYGFCADVMEHIPTEKVDAVLRNIAGKVTGAAYFRISTAPDGMGALIGETLHLTVRPADWWRQHIASAFGAAIVKRVAADHCVIIGQRA